MSSNLRHDAKRDANEPVIINALERIGAMVEQINGTDIPDLLVLYRGQVTLLEVKDGNRKPTQGQQSWHQRAALHGCKVYVVRTVEEAVKAVTDG